MITDRGTPVARIVALLEMWKDHSGNVLTLRDLERVEGITGAVARRSDAVYTSLDNGDQAIAERVLLRLVQLRPDRTPATRPLRIAELTGGNAERAILDRFREVGLISIDSDHVRLSHEMLVSEWPLLHDAIRRHQRVLEAEAVLEASAGRWHRQNRGDDLLARG